ncbi:MAG: ABC transporter ATP-binding protein [Solirubrobacterales bacterium]|nr:ABC transporter ATP-binding protein [Solirubrobacterales bacterium]
MSDLATDTSLMEIQDLEVTFRQRRKVVRAIDGVSLEWRPGEVLGIVGESGCGKSTLARAMLGLQETSGGQVLLEGRPVAGKSDLNGLRRRVQMIFQDPYQTLNPRQKIGQIVAEPLVVQGVEKRLHPERIRQAMQDVGLDPERFLDRYPHQLSGGQRQRVAIAAALVLEPDGLICDEPTSMLDVSVRSQILSVLLGLREERGLALIFITHDLSLAWSLCDRTLVMYLGRIVEEGSAVDVIEHPRHPYTEALVAAVPATGTKDGPRRLPKGDLPDPANLPSGCRFHPRCPKRFEPCDRVDPALVPAGSEGQQAACLLYGETEDHQPS